jgi:copper(I)-binding protein
MLARAAASILSLLLVFSIAACGSAAGNSAKPASGPVSIDGAWVRAAQSGVTTAAYMTITNGTAADDTLVSVATPAAMSASLHQTSTDASGMTGMHPVEGITVPAGGTVKLEPGGYHVMLMGLTGDLAAGQVVQLTLTFKAAGKVDVSAEVRAS